MINELPKYIKPWPQILTAIIIGISLTINPLIAFSNKLNSSKKSDSLSETDRILHVLNRLGYGARPGDIERVRQIGIEKYIDQQLNPARIDDNAIEKRLNGLETLSMSPEELVKAYPPPQLVNGKNKGKNRLGDNMDDEKDSKNEVATEKIQKRRRQMLDPDDVKGKPREILIDLSQDHLLRAVYSERQLQEVMTDFWINHFNIFWAKGLDRYLLAPYIKDDIRPNVLGSFPKMLAATAKSPAMLFYLDNWLSVDPKAGERLAAQREEILKRREERNSRRRAFGREGERDGGFNRQERRHPFGDDSAIGATAPRRANRLENERADADRQLNRESANSTPKEKESPAKQRKNRKLGLNENYARELMELHTLGVDGGYTQKDVTEVARCFTGWSIRKAREDAEFSFNERMHDNGEKTVLGVKIPAGGGQQDGEKVLEILANHPATARFIATKLVRHFVSDDAPSSLVDRVAAIYLKTKGDISAMLRTIFTSAEFNSPKYFNAKIKSPLALVASALRASDAETNMGPQILMSLGRMGQPLFLCQPPTGYGDTAEKWVNTASLVERLNFAVALCEGRLPGTNPKLVKSLANVNSLDKLIEVVLHDNVGEKTRAALEQELGSRNISTEKMPKLVGLLLGSPEFQKM